MALIGICLGYFMVILDATAVNLSLPALGRELGGGVGLLQWVVAGYTLTFAALLLSAGHAGDRLGARRVFLAGLGLFVVASAACGLAPSVPVLVAARLVQGVGAAILVPCSLSLLQSSYADRRARARAVGVWGGIAGIGAASGPVIGGLLTQEVSWRLVFFLNVPAGLLALYLVVRHVAPSPRSTDGRGFDPVAQVAAVACLAALTFALIEARHGGWTVVVGFGVAVASGLVFLLVELRREHPMLPLGLFRRGAFAGGSTVGLLINLGCYGQLFVTSLYFQDVRHYSALAAGLALLPEGLFLSVASVLSGRVSGRLGTRPTMLGGLAIGALGFFGLMAAGRHTPYLVLLVPLAAAGFGMAFTMPAATSTVVEAAPAARAGVAAGTINAFRQVGSTVGVALLGTLFATGVPVAMAAAGGAFALAMVVVVLTVRSHAAGEPSGAVGRVRESAPR